MVLSNQQNTGPFTNQTHFKPFACQTTLVFRSFLYRLDICFKIKMVLNLLQLVVLYVAVSQIIHESVMSIYLNKLVHVQVIYSAVDILLHKCALGKTRSLIHLRGLR